MRTLTISDPAFLAAASRPPQTAPPSISGPAAVWWAGDLALADGDPVSTWTDRTNSIAATNTSTARPTYAASGINGRPSLRFDGTDDALHVVAANAVSNSPNGAVIAVVTMDAPSGGANTVCGSADHASATRFLSLRRFNTGDVMELVQRNNDTPTDRVVSGNAIPEATPVALEFGRPATGSALYQFGINNAVESLTATSGTISGDWFGNVTGRDGFTIGADRRDTITNYFKGDIAFLAVIDGNVPDAERTALYAWISAQYGITVA